MDDSGILMDDSNSQDQFPESEQQVSRSEKKQDSRQGGNRKKIRHTNASSRSNIFQQFQNPAKSKCSHNVTFCFLKASSLGKYIKYVCIYI